MAEDPSLAWASLPPPIATDLPPPPDDLPPPPSDIPQFVNVFHPPQPGSPQPGRGLPRSQSVPLGQPRSIQRSGSLTAMLAREVSDSELKILALQSQQPQHGTINSKKIRARYHKTVRVSKGNKELKAHLLALEKGEKTSNPKLGQQKCLSLQGVATQTQDVVKFLIKAVNSAVLAPSSFNEATIVGHVSKICETLQMVLILTDAPDVDPTIKKLVESLAGYLDVMAKHKNVDHSRITAAATAAGQLVQMELAKRIHEELMAVKNLSLQVTCIIRYIATVDIDHHAFVQLASTTKAFSESIRELLSAVYTLMHIHENNIKPGSDTASEATASVWSETTKLESLPQNKNSVAVGTLNQLINKLAGPEKINKELMRTMVMTYRSFTMPRTFLEKLQERYHAPPGAEAAAIKKNVAAVLHFWIHAFLFDFDEHMVTQVDSILLEMIDDPLTSADATALYKYLEERITQRRGQRLVWFAQDHSDQIELLEEGLAVSELILEVPPQLIAEQLTCIEERHYLSLEPFEFLNQNWSKDSSKHRSPNLVALIRRSTRLSHWVAIMVLSQNNPLFRTQMFEKMIDLCQCLFEARNFNTLMGVVAGMNLASVSRLKLAKKKVDKKKVAVFKGIMKTMAPAGSHKLYRQTLSASPAATIPYMAVALMDLTFIDEGNDNEVDGLINFEKRELTAREITAVLSFQQGQGYRIKPLEPLYSFLDEMPLLDEDELYNISLALEPRASSDKKEKKSKEKDLW